MGKFLLLVALLLPGAAQAQWVAGDGDDASLPARGTARVGISYTFRDYDTRFTGEEDGGTEPLGADFDAVALERLPGGTLAQSRIRALAGLPTLTLTLGNLDVRPRGTVERFPMTLELGVLRRVALTASVPIVRTRTTVLIGSEIGVGGDAGINPAITLDAARTTNLALSSALAGASQQLRDRLAQCEGSLDPECDAVNADRAGAEALAAGAESFGEDLALVYVDGHFVPVVASEADQAIVAQLAAMRAQFENYGVTALANAPERPVGASTIAHEQLQAFITDPQFGIGADPFVTIERTSIGDIETGAKILLVDRIDPAGNRPLGLRLLASGLVRFGTGTADLPRNLLDIGTGDGQTDIEAGAVLDAVFGRRLALTARARYTRQLEGDVAVRVPEFAGQLFVPASREAIVRRDPGDIVTMEAVPRIAIHEVIAITGLYSFFRKGADAHTPVTVPALVDEEIEVPDAASVALLDAGTGYRVHRWGYGLSYSNLAAHRRGRARFAYEVSYLHLRAGRASGAPVPRDSESRLLLRVLVPIWGR